MDLFRLSYLTSEKDPRDCKPVMIKHQARRAHIGQVVRNGEQGRGGQTLKWVGVVIMNEEVLLTSWNNASKTYTNIPGHIQA